LIPRAISPIIPTASAEKEDEAKAKFRRMMEAERSSPSRTRSRGPTTGRHCDDRRLRCAVLKERLRRLLVGLPELGMQERGRARRLLMRCVLLRCASYYRIILERSPKGMKLESTISRKDANISALRDKTCTSVRNLALARSSIGPTTRTRSRACDLGGSSG